MNPGPIRVLIVEDDERISELHRRFTEKLDGFEVVGLANSLAGAAEMLEVLEPDLVLLDLFFPEGNGMELLRQMRIGAAPSDFILITAAREMAFLQEALRGGAFDYIIKPVSFPRFQDALQKYRDFFHLVRSGGSLEQKDVDHLLYPHPVADGGSATLPKGVDPLTLKKIRLVFENPGVKDLGAEEVGAQVGVSRSTARRYLEFMVSEGFLVADLLYGAVGRPERRYLRKG
jgi:two-component system CitB family response regulator/two-component system response regulator DcuR